MNKVISREYVEKNYINKEILKKAIKEGILEAKGWGQEGGAYILAKIIEEKMEETKDGNK